MKKKFFILLIIMVYFCISCGKDEPDDLLGGFEYKVNKTQMRIPAGGGSDSIRVLNDKLWFIQAITVTVNGKETQYDIQEVQCMDYDGGWFSVKVPLYNPRWVIARVDDSMRDLPYEIRIKMGAISPHPCIYLTVKKK